MSNQRLSSAKINEREVEGEVTLQDVLGILGIFASIFIAYHIYFLSKRLGFRDKLTHSEEIRNKVEELLGKVRKGINRKVELVNIYKYKKYYPQNNDYNRLGYTYLGAEIKDIRYDGIEFFAEMPKEIYLRPDGKYGFKKTKKKVNFLVYPVGLIPYEWIEYIDLRGNEFGYNPLFFVNFKGIKKYPYKRMFYYKKSERYDKSTDPLGMEFVETIEVEDN
ncbi:MAG: hypothetical protein WCO23_00675 [bacterium]